MSESKIKDKIKSGSSSNLSEENGKKVLDFVLSDEGQKLWAEAYLRPVRANAMSPEAAAKFLPSSEYARAKAVDFGKMAEKQQSFGEQYLQVMH